MQQLFATVLSSFPLASSQKALNAGQWQMIVNDRFMRLKLFLRLLQLHLSLSLCKAIKISLALLK